MNMNIKTLQNIMYKLFGSGGNTIINGEHAFQIHKCENGPVWVAYLPVDEYRKKYDQYDKSPTGWYALLRIA